MLGIDIVKVGHIQYLLSYCGAHRNCDTCPVVEFCKKLEVKVLNVTKYPGKSEGASEEDLLMIINLREYCNDCERCVIGCKRKSECDNLMQMIIDDHKENKQEKPKALTGDTKEKGE